MELYLDRRAVKQIRLSAQEAIEEGDSESLREDILEAFTEEQVEEIEPVLEKRQIDLVRFGIPLIPGRQVAAEAVDDDKFCANNDAEQTERQDGQAELMAATRHKSHTRSSGRKRVTQCKSQGLESGFSPTGILPLMRSLRDTVHCVKFSLLLCCSGGKIRWSTSTSNLAREEADHGASDNGVSAAGGASPVLGLACCCRVGPTDVCL